MTAVQRGRIARLVGPYLGDERSARLAWARTLALSHLVLDDLTGDRDDEGVRILSHQLALAAVITLSCGGDLDVAATHHDRLAADLDAVRPGEDARSALGSAVLAHRLAAQICRGDLARLRRFASHRRDGEDYAAELGLPPV
ncbi:hypothetical protein CLV46_1751 [Diaminobutyricimonas aerilata]|uniref:Uncharacterized protein n=1 Tax=Diaminobutyricimonas aerilata TaxID=1162967 RepID=A0A2M9CJW5_9MICO|nr:hypothetical protein [Diaminobutyricimonas aerilata]PJJ72186.1 hypothetical protein CLV46_1751 [Diaminobutyricimonas aerilata]